VCANKASNWPADVITCNQKTKSEKTEDETLLSTESLLH